MMPCDDNQVQRMSDQSMLCLRQLVTLTTLYSFNVNA